MTYCDPQAESTNACAHLAMRRPAVTASGLLLPDFNATDPRPVALAMAMAYEARVFPCFGIRRNGTCTCRGRSRGGHECSPGKHPKVGFLTKATSDFDTLQGFFLDDQSWEGSPLNNWAVATGCRSGLAIIDKDGEIGFTSIEAAEEQLGPLPDGPKARSGRVEPGEHLYFRLDPGRPAPPNTASRRLGPGVDVRGEGGFAILPGSLHKSGRRYAWVDGFSPSDIELPVLPEAWHVHLTADMLERAAPRVSKPRRPATQAERVERERTYKLGDGEGRGGFDGPIYRLACRYFALSGYPADSKPFIDAVRLAIAEAPKAEGRDVARYLSQAYLERRVEDARAFIAQSTH